MTKVFWAVACLLCCAGMSVAQVTIIETGSTNTPGMNVKMKKAGPQAMIEPKEGAAQKLMLKKDLCRRLMKDLAAAGALDKLPEAHCMKSASFGTSLFVEYKGVRSPDLSCPQTDGRMAALKKDVNEIMAAAKEKAPEGMRQVYR